MYLILILTFFITSCSHTVKVKTPVHKFVNAESQGKLLKGRISTYFINGSDAELDLSNNKTDNPLNTWEGNIDTQIFGLTGELGLYGPVDFVYISGGVSGTSLYAGKVQVYGKQRYDNASENFSVAFIAGYGNEKKRKHEGDDVEIWPEDEDTNIDLQLSQQSVGMLLSYRTNSKYIYTLGYYKTRHHFTGNLDSQNTCLDGKRVDYNGVSTVATLGLTYEFESKFYVGFEAAHEDTKWEKSDRVSHTHIGGNVGYAW